MANYRVEIQTMLKSILLLEDLNHPRGDLTYFASAVFMIFF